jgi:hypothetical protein
MREDNRGKNKANGGNIQDIAVCEVMKRLPMFILSPKVTSLKMQTVTVGEDGMKTGIHLI